ncbi:MAG TPA: hypothetical protein VGL26_10335 [Jatrophihabitans sp.]|jgi:hypothetical protein
MKRRVFDLITSIVGLGLAVLLFIAGGLLTWANTFVGNEVHKELSNQQIFFPAKAALSSLPAKDAAAMGKYAGKKMTTGAQAETYADHFIAVHLSEMPSSTDAALEAKLAPYKGHTYAQLGTDISSTTDQAVIDALTSTRATVFQGETLRGLLLNAYAFGTMGTIAGIAAIAAWIGGGLLTVLGGLGLWHSRRVGGDTEVLIPHEHTPTDTLATV